MKNSNKRFEKISRFLSKNGDLLILILCAAAVAISGWLFVSAAIRRSAPSQEQTLSVPVTPVPPEPAAQPSQAAAAESEPEEDPPETETMARQEPQPSVVLPVKGETVQEFSTQALSYNETTQDWRLHSAVDIAADGQDVVACMAGTVERVYDDDYLGTTVVIAHSGGLETVYANLAASPAVAQGQRVTAGDVIGTVGNTAILEAASVPHLHFQVLRDGQAVDPVDFLS